MAASALGEGNNCVGEKADFANHQFLDSYDSSRSSCCNKGNTTFEIADGFSEGNNCVGEKADIANHPFLDSYDSSWSSCCNKGNTTFEIADGFKFLPGHSYSAGGAPDVEEDEDGNEDDDRVEDGVPPPPPGPQARMPCSNPGCRNVAAWQCISIRCKDHCHSVQCVRHNSEYQQWIRKQLRHERAGRKRGGKKVHDRNMYQAASRLKAKGVRMPLRGPC